MAKGKALRNKDKVVRKVPVPTQPPQPEKPWPRPAIGIPLERAISHADKVFFNFLAIAQQGFPFIAVNYGRTDLVRNKFGLHTLSSDITHLIMLDVDHVHRFDIVQAFMRRFIENPEVRVVAGMNFRRGEPYDPCAYIFGDDERYHPIAQWDRGSLLKVDAVGTGTIAIDRRVFEDLDFPWFQYDYSKAMDDNWPGEDMFFSKLCMDNGIDLFVDPEITSPHMIDAVVDESTFREYNEKNGKGAIPIEQVVSRMKKELQNEGDRTE